MEHFITLLVLLFKSWKMSAVVKTWPHHTLWGELYRFLTQPVMASAMRGKLSRSFDWITINQSEEVLSPDDIVIPAGAINELDTITVTPELSAPRRGTKWWSMAVAMIRWNKCLVLAPTNPHCHFRIGFSAIEERGHVLQYCAIVFSPGSRVRVLKGPYTTKFFALDMKGNLIPLIQEGEYDGEDRQVVDIPLI